MTSTDESARRAFLHAYDTELRGAPEVQGAFGVERCGPLFWARFDRGGFVTYRSLEGRDVVKLIARTVEHFRDSTHVEMFEWKTRGHDSPRELPQLLGDAHFTPDDQETVMIGSCEHLVTMAGTPPGATVRQAGDGADLTDDVSRALSMQEAVFGRGGGPSVASMVRDLTREDSTTQLWLAEVDGAVVSAGRLEVVPGTRFAGIWGGATLPAHRGRGIYRSLTAARAKSALAQGYSLIQSDCTEMSRPILERAGLMRVTTTTPWNWYRHPTSSLA